jgi:hypothetical protein
VTSKRWPRKKTDIKSARQMGTRCESGADVLL